MGEYAFPLTGFVCWSAHVTFDGTGSWKDYRAHFDPVAELNGWSPVEKGLYLAVSLRGQVQGVFGNISTQSRD